MKKKSILIGVCCFLALLTGVVVIEGEQEVQQLKTTGKNSQMTEGEKESPLTGEKRLTDGHCTHHLIHTHICIEYDKCNM